MTNSNPIPLIHIEPHIASVLKTLLVHAGEDVLAAQVDKLVVVQQIDHSHGSDFYMVPRPKGRWGPNHRTLGLRPGTLHIDVVSDKIVCVEVLRKQSQIRPCQLPVGLFPLEQAALIAIALQVPEAAIALDLQKQQVRVTARENTGAGFFTSLDTLPGTQIEGIRSPLGDVGATVFGLKHGMGFLLWLQDGRIAQLEGYSYEESTIGIDFDRVAFGTVHPRK